MKNIQLKMLLVLLLTVKTVFTVNAQTLIYDFAFNNSLSTSVGTGAFANSNVTFVPGRFGHANTAIRLNNAGTTATLTGLPLSSNSRTIALWVKMDTLRSDFNFIYSYGTATNAEGLYIRPAQINHFTPNHSKVATFNTTSWFHLVVTYTGTASRIYVNGVLLGSQNLIKNTANNANLFRLGLSEGGAPDFFRGLIDDLKIYSGALTDLQVSALYSSCIPPMPVSVTPNVNLNICPGNTTTLNVQSDSSVNWFNTPSGGTSIGSGNTFVTPVLTTTTTFYAEAGLNCKSARLPLIVNINSSVVPSTPQIITDTARIYCIGTKLVLSAKGSGPVRWYDAAIGGNLLGTGDSLITPALQNNAPQGEVGTTTFYAETFNSCSNPQNSARIPVNIKVNGDFLLTTNMPSDSLFICSGSTTMLLVNSIADSLRWTLNGTIVSQNSVHNTQPINSNRTYILTATKNGACTKQAFFPIKVYNSYSIAPTNTSGTLPSFCSRDTVMLSATSLHDAPLYWFTTATGGTAYQIGDTALTKVLGAYNASTTIYYVQSGIESCASPRTPISVNFTYAPLGNINLSGSTISASNLYETYVLRKDGQVVAQSNITGNINLPNATCGQYQATFTNTVNTPCNSIASVRISKNPNVYGNSCYTFGITTESWLHNGTILASVAGGPFGSLTDILPTQISYISSVCGVSANTNITFRFISPNGCSYDVTRTFSSIPNGNVNTHLNAPLSNASRVGFDTLTTCNIRSNIINIGLNQPSVNGTPIANLSVCKGQTTTLFATGSGTLKWYAQATGGMVIDSGSTFKTPAISATTTYYVEVTSGTCKSSRTPITVTLKTTPTASISPVSPTICAGKSVELIASGGNSYSWIEPISSLPNIIVAPTNSTTYKAVALLSNGCRDTAFVTVVVKPISQNQITQTLCFGQTTIFKGETLTQSGIYRDTLTNVLGCDSIITLNFLVKPKAEKLINAGICNGQSYTFKGKQINLPGKYYDTLTTILGCDSFIVLNLSVNNFVIGEASIAICQGQSYNFNGRQLTQAGQYVDTLVSVAGCDSILTLSLAVNSLPLPTISKDGNKLSTQNFASYQWKLNNNDITGANDRLFTPVVNGNYSVEVSDNNTCKNVSVPFAISSVGLLNLKQLNISIYPNPAKEQFSISHVPTHTKIQLMSIEGKVLFTKWSENDTETIDTKDWLPGVYMVSLEIENRLHLSKIQIMH